MIKYISFAISILIFFITSALSEN
mgnify:CR=1